MKKRAKSKRPTNVYSEKNILAIIRYNDEIMLDVKTAKLGREILNTLTGGRLNLNSLYMNMLYPDIPYRIIKLTRIPQNYKKRN